MFDGASYEIAYFAVWTAETYLVVYSDGLTEAENPQAEVFGEKRLRRYHQAMGAFGRQCNRAKAIGGRCGIHSGHAADRRRDLRGG